MLLERLKCKTLLRVQKLCQIEIIQDYTGSCVGYKLRISKCSWYSGGGGGYLFVISGESELAVTAVRGITTALNVKPVSNYKSKFTHLHIQISEIRAKAV